MWSLILVIGASVIAALAILFTLCAAFYRFALAIDALFTFLASPFGYLAKKCEQFQEGCKNIISRWSDIDIKELITRLLYLTVGVVIWAGDVPFAIERIAALLDIPLPQIPVLFNSLPLFGGLLWLAVPTMFGIVLFDRRFITTQSRVLQWISRFCVLVLLIVALVDLALFFYYGQLSISSTRPIGEWKELALPITLLFGGLVGVAAIFGFRAIEFGLYGLAIVLVGFVYCIFLLFHVVFTLLGLLLSGIGDMLTYVQLRPTKIKKPGPIIVETDDTIKVPGVQVGTNGVQDGIAPDYYELGEGIIVSKQNIVAFALGQQSLEYLEKFLLRLMHIGGAKLLLGYGGIDQYHAIRGKQLPKVHGAKLIVPPQQALDVAQGRHGGGDEVFYALSQAVVSELKQVYSGYANGVMLLFIDAELIPGLKPTIEMLKGSLPMCEIAIITSLPEPARRDVRMQMANKALIDLQEGKKVRVTFLTDPRSPFVAKRDITTQEEFVALALASLAVAHEQFSERNPSLAKLLELLGMLSPVIGFSGATAHVAEGKPVVGWGILRKLNPKKVKPRGVGDVFSVVNEEGLMMEVVLTHHEALMTSYPVNSAGHFLMVFVIPIRLDDKRFYESAELILNNQHKKFRNGGSIVVREQGITDFLLGEGYFCSCICLYPLTKEALLLEEEELRELPPGGN